MAIFVMGPGSDCFGADAGEAYYSVQVASYKNAIAAEARVAALKNKGYQFFSDAVNVPGKGKWYRVAEGKYQNRKEAATAGAELKEKGVIKAFIIVKMKSGDRIGKTEQSKTKDKSIPAESTEKTTPKSAPAVPPKNEYYSVYVNSCKNMATADAQAAALKARGYYFFSYALDHPGKGQWYRVAEGKYQSRKEAAAAGAKLIKKGIIQVVRVIKMKPENTTVTSENNPPPAVPVALAKQKPAFIPALEKTLEEIKTSENYNAENNPPPAVSVTLAKQEPASVSDSAKNKTPAPITQKAVQIKVSAESTKNTAPQSAPTAPLKENPAQSDKEAAMHTLPASPEKQVKVPLTPADTLHGSAMHDFINRRYREALPKFKEMAAAGDRKTAMRRMADCYYFLGRKGNKQQLLKAIEQYRMNIKNNPTAHRENAQALYRLADGYKTLNFFYEALAGFEDLCRGYPESKYAPDALFMMGKMNYQIGRFSRAIEKFEAYIKRYPVGKYVKDAHFAVGDCYSKLRQFDDADLWYGNALGRWPALEDIPEDTLSQLGSRYYSIQKYNDALEVFYVYLNLFPKGREYKSVLCKVALVFEKMGQLPMALKMLSLVLEQYPDTREARQCAILMADIGAKNTALNLPPSIFTGKEYYYRDPISVYDEMAKKNSNLGMEEELAFRKGAAQLKKKMYRQAFDTYRLLLDKFSSGPYRETIEKNLILSADRLVDDYFKNGLYLQAFDTYRLLLDKFSSGPYRETIGKKIVLSADRLLDDYFKKELYLQAFDTYRLVLDKIPDGIHRKTIEKKFMSGIGRLVDEDFKKGLYLQAFDTYRLVLDKFPDGIHRKMIEKKLVSGIDRLIDDHHAKNNHIDVAAAYFKSNKKIILDGGDFGMLLKISNSLELVGLHEQAIEILEKISKRFPKDKRINEVRVAKAQIYYGMDRHKEAREILEKLRRKPSELSKKSVLRSGSLMGNIFFEKHLFREAGEYYLEALKAGEQGVNSDAVRKKYADSLKEMGRHADALENYRMVLKNCTDADDPRKCPDSTIMGSYEGAGDCLYGIGSIQEAILMYEELLNHKSLEADKRKVVLFKAGRGYTRLGDTAMAEKSFGLLNNGTDDEFWPAIVDNYMTHKNWTEKYGKYL